MNDADYYRDRATTFRELVAALQRRLCPNGVHDESDYVDLLEAHAIRVEAERDAALERASDAEDQERFVTAQRDRYAVQRDHALERLRQLENTGRIGHPAVELAEVACQRDEWRRRYEQLMAEIGEASK